MNLTKFLPLTETTFYILLALSEPGYGLLIMQKVEELSEGKVRIAAGTMYGAIEILLSKKLIEPVSGENKRRKMYIITELGKDILTLEVQRINSLLNAAQKYNYCFMKNTTEDDEIDKT